MTANDMANTLPLTTSELNHYTNLWCREKGIHAKDLTAHPHADDVVLMLRIREDMFDKFNASERAVWGAYWNTIYHKRRPIHKKALKKLEQITITASDRHLENTRLQVIQRQRIQALKQNPYSKSSDDIVAKTDDSTYSVPWE
jgi:hypothetical protein